MKKTYSFLYFAVFLSASLISQTTPYIGVGHTSGVTVTTSGTGLLGEGVNTINASGMDQHLKNASRFLGQTTTGVNFEYIEYVSELDFGDWIDAQILMPEMNFLDTTRMVWDHFVQAYYDEWGEVIINGNENIFPSSFYWRMAWWNNFSKGEDYLRQRMALALSEILVVSEDSNLEADAFGLASYYDLIYSNALGNYGELLKKVTYHPAMGYYLSSINNSPTIEEENIHPDENYAREIMQLFTIGLYELHPDGTLILDDEGMTIPTYSNNDVGEFARIFTGLGPAQYWAPWVDYSEEVVEWGVWYNNVPYINSTMPMVMFEGWHEEGVKHLLNDWATVEGALGDQDIDLAIQNLTHHPNLAPFISKALIQRLVKSNPTPEYVFRVVEIFEDNGFGEKGDLAALAKAIFLDPEARDCEWISNPVSGKMREPMIRYMQLLRAFDASNESGKMWSVGWLPNEVGQHPMDAPSVFNFFLPSYAPSGPVSDSSLVAPEFQLLNSAIAIKYINTIQDMIFGSYYMSSVTQADPVELGYPYWDIAFEQGEDFIDINLYDEELLASTDTPAMVKRLDILLTGGTASPETLNAITDVVDLDVLPPLDKVKVALYLMLVSPDYIIQK